MSLCHAKMPICMRFFYLFSGNEQNKIENFFSYIVNIMPIG